MDVAQLIWFLAGYALGAIPFGVLVTRLGGAGEPEGDARERERRAGAPDLGEQPG